MPTAPPAVPRSGPTRRTLLVSTVAVGVVASGCTATGTDQPHAAPHSKPPDVDPDVTLAATVLGHEQQVLDAVIATARRHKGLRDQLSDARAEHEKHVQLLRQAVPDHAVVTAEPSPGATTGPTAGTTTGPTAGTTTGSPAPEPTVPHDPRKAVLALSRQEDRLSLTDKRGAFAAESGAFARVLGSMAAAAAQQSVVLRQLSRTVPGRA